MIQLYGTFRSKEFSCQIPDVVFFINHDRASVKVSVIKSGDETVVYDEVLYPEASGRITLSDIDVLIEPYADRWLSFNLKVEIKEQLATVDGKGNEVFVNESSIQPLVTLVISCRANILNMTADDWCRKRFLTLMDGVRTTAIGWLEYLYFIGDDTVSVASYFDDGTSFGKTLTVVQGDGYCRIDASPANFLISGRKLLRYVISAGDRRQEYVVDYDVEPEIAPVLLFWNSFGVQELAYCTGELKMADSFDRKQARIGRLKKTYEMEEKVTFKADTGILSFPMANWWREVLRSRDVSVLDVVNGGVDLSSGKSVVITSEKSELSNAPDHLPRYTFEYEYADRNHNVFDTRREGRIFDDTFDYTFN